MFILEPLLHLKPKTTGASLKHATIHPHAPKCIKNDKEALTTCSHFKEVLPSLFDEELQNQNK